MDLAISYLGLRLDSPLVVGASPLADDLDDVRRLEDAGASCIVLRSLFEEQITREKYGTVYSLEIGDPADTEIRSVIAGASAVQVVSALLENGPQYLRVLREGMESLLARKGYRSLDELKASLCADPFPDPQAHSRASYMQLLQRWSA